MLEYDATMPKEYSPFTPGQPVPIEFFVGRVSEIKRMQAALEEAMASRLRVGFLVGERGIGKSSLARFVRFLGERDYSALGVHALLGGVNTLEEMVRRVLDRLVKDSLGRTWQGKIEEFLGKHVRQVDMFGVTLEFGASHADLERMVHDFAPVLRRLVARLKPDRKGIFLVLDDINGLAESSDFANWLKSLVDEIATSDEPIPLYLLLVGLEERRQSLIARQLSLARVFDIVEIRPWSEEETADFFEKSFSKVNLTIARDARSSLAQFSGGLPVLAHEIGDATFRADEDGKIDLADATKGILAAADVVGRKHLEPRVFQAIRSDRYRSILRKVAEHAKGINFRRSDVLAHLTSAEQKVFDNFLRRMRELDVVRPDPEQGTGAYRFDNLLHALYLQLEASKAK